MFFSNKYFLPAVKVKLSILKPTPTLEYIVALLLKTQRCIFKPPEENVENILNVPIDALHVILL